MTTEHRHQADVASHVAGSGRPDASAPRPTARDATLVIVVVTFNSASTVTACLRSLSAALRHAGLQGQAHVIVWDNASEDQSVELARPYADTLIESPTNVGFGPACNQALHGTDTAWIMLLNPDTRVPPHGLVGLGPVMREHWSATTLLVPQLLNPDGRRQPNLFLLPTPWSETALALGGRRAHALTTALRRGLLGRQPVHVSGALFVCTGALWNALGGFDPRYFLYAEETDFCARAQAAGLTLRDVPNVTVVHYGSQGARAMSTASLLLQIHSKLHFLRQYHGAVAAHITAVAWAAGALFRLVPMALMGQWSAFHGYRAVAATLTRAKWRHALLPASAATIFSPHRPRESHRHCGGSR